MKYRAGKIKREHSVIEKLWPCLEQMAASDLITTIIPGPISPLSAKSFEITFQRFTETGLRLLAKNGSAVQEVYLVAPEREATLAWLAAEGFVDWKPEPAPKARVFATGPEPLKTVVVPLDYPCQICGHLISGGSRAVRVGKRAYTYVHIRCAK